MLWHLFGKVRCLGEMAANKWVDLATHSEPEWMVPVICLRLVQELGG